jgi:DhnA family fructose-bisphosphate aldolase class Ia
MTSQVGKAIRLSKILDPKGGPALLLRADVGLALGPVAGLEDMESALRSAVSAGVDGVVLGPGQAGRHIDLFKGRNGPSLLEAGADAIIVPYTGSRSTMSEVVESSGHAPVLLLVEGDEGAIKPSINAGVRGVLVAEYAFASGLGPALESIHKALGKGA